MSAAASPGVPSAFLRQTVTLSRRIQTSRVLPAQWNYEFGGKKGLPHSLGVFGRTKKGEEEEEERPIEFKISKRGIDFLRFFVRVFLFEFQVGRVPGRKGEGEGTVRGENERDRQGDNQADRQTDIDRKDGH